MLTLPAAAAALFASLFVSRAVGQALPPALVQNSSFNSTFQLSSAQVAAANLSETDARSINNVVSNLQSQQAYGGPAQDAFYSLPPGTKMPSQPGVILKTQDFTNTSSYSLAPNTALSRIIYTTTDLNGTVVPASAFILWPFAPRTFPNLSASQAQVVLWNHGTSGFFSANGPSSQRFLYYGDQAPFTLALDGYAVVAPDYAGLGFNTNLTDNTPLPHQYLASTTSADDALYALQAARAAFPGRLGKNFVSMGQSQGGGVAWAVAEAVAAKPALGPGYLGTIAVSPVTQVFGGPADAIGPWVALALPGIFPSFTWSDWLTPLGIARLELFKQLQGNFEVWFYLINDGQAVVKPGINETWYATAYAALGNAGRKNTTGPVLVIQGSADSTVYPNLTTATVDATCKLFPGDEISYVLANGTLHVPTLEATRHLWLDWIRERFGGAPLAPAPCGAVTHVDSFLPLAQYQATGQSDPLWNGAPGYLYEDTLEG